MANYQSIKGFNIQSKSSDPVPFAQEIANNPYSGAWSSGGSMNTARQRMGGDGTQSALIVAGGTTPSPTDQKALAETYNGSSWTEVGDLNTGRTDLALAGTTTASLAADGSAATGVGNFVESWNGASWTETTENNSARYQLAGFGIQTAMVIAGGLVPPFSALTEYWNGSSWTEVNDLNTARQGLTNGGTGVYTAGMVAGGRKAHPSDPGVETGDTEIWNATSWTEVNNLNEARQVGGLFGTSTSAIYGGGADAGTPGKAESWDGSSWTETSALTTARYNSSAGGTSNQSGIIAGGTPSGVTEEWSFSGLQPTDPAAGYTDSIVGDMYYNSTTGQFKAIKSGGAPIGSWSSGGAMNTARVFDATAQTGTNSAGQIAGGTYPGGGANTEQYDGTSWTEVNNLNTARFDIFGVGTQTSALAASGYTTDWVANTEKWNGTSWTEVNDVNQARKEGGSSGISNTSALIFGGEGTPSSTQYALTEKWNGTSWTEVGDLNAAIYGTSGGGTQTDAIRAGGVTSGSANPSATVETWDGTSWTETTNINTSRGYNAAVATGSTSAMIAGGTTNAGPSLSALTEAWNGSSWTEVSDLATARYKVNGAGTPLEALAIGGGPNTSGGTATEEWTAADFEIKTVTTS